MSKIKWISHDQFNVNDIPFANKDYEGRLRILKYHHMLSLYEKVLFELKPKKIFEIGLFQGASLALFSELVPDALIGGVDLGHSLPALELYRTMRNNPPIYTAVADQTDAEALEDFCQAVFGGVEDIDLIVDDASHLYHQTKASFAALFPKMHNGSIYIIEDWGWAHWPADEWQKEGGQWWNETPLSLLIFEITMLMCSCSGLISSMELYNEGGSAFCVIRRGPTQVTGPLFDQVKSRNLKLAFNRTDSEAPLVKAPASAAVDMRKAYEEIIKSSDDYLGARAQATAWKEYKDAQEYQKADAVLFNFSSDDQGLASYVKGSFSAETIKTPPEDIYNLHQSYVTEIGLVFLESQDVFLPSAADQSPENIEEAKRLLRFQEVPYIDGTAVFIFKSGKDNYGHILVEMLPKIEAVASSCDGVLTFIMPRLSKPLRKMVTDFIDILYPGKFAIHEMEGPHLKVQNLIYPGPVSKHNRRKSPTLLAMRDRLMQALPADGESPRKLYVSRRKCSNRQMLNEARVEEMLQARGYTVAYPEEKSFLEQAMLFRNAEVIVGPLGAAMTNIIFAPSGSRVIELDPGLYDVFFHDIASLNKQKFMVVFGRKLVQMKKSMLHQSYVFPEDILQEALCSRE